MTKYRTAGRLRVWAGRMLKTRKTRKRELEKDRSKRKNAGRHDEQNELATYKQRTQV